MAELLRILIFEENLVEKMLKGISDRVVRKVQGKSGEVTSKRPRSHSDLNKLTEIRKDQKKSHRIIAGLSNSVVLTSQKLVESTGTSLLEVLK